LVECNHEWIDNLQVRSGSQDGNAGQHCKICYVDKWSCKNKNWYYGDGSKMKLLQCNLCGWYTYSTNVVGIARHEKWHDAKEPFTTTNRITGKVEWEEFQ